MTTARFARSLALALALGGGARVAAGQGAVIGARATVGTPAIVTAQQALLFGTVLPGVPKPVSPVTGGAGGATAGRFSVLGLRNAEIELSFTLPGLLVSGASTMLLDTWQACRNTVNATAGCVAFVPSSAGDVARLSNTAGFTGQLWLWLGATARPAPNQPAGTYTGQVTLSAVYTGF